MINNLHSLINGKFYIESSYAHAQLPLLVNILSGNIDLKNPTKPLPDAIVFSNRETITSDNFNSNDNKEKYVAIVGIKHPIYKYSQFCGPRGTKDLQKRLEVYEKDSNCLGVVQDIDSGGGQVSGTPEYYDFVKNYSKPIVSYTDGMMCSAAYYIASSSNYIIGNKRLDCVGSIGVMISFLDPTGMYVKKGAKLITEYATKSTDKNADWEELLQGKPEKYIKEQLDPLADQFHEDVLAVRPTLNKKVLSGGVYNSKDAIKLNLIDAEGTLQDAIDKVISLSKSNNSQNMSNTKKEFPKLQAALGMEQPFEDTANVYLQEHQLTELEQTLEANATALQTANNSITQVQTSLDNANASLQTEKENTTALTTAITNACKEQEIENYASLTPVEQIAALNELTTEYGALDGAKKTTATTNVDGSSKGNQPVLAATQKLQSTIENL